MVCSSVTEYSPRKRIFLCQVRTVEREEKKEREQSKKRFQHMSRSDTVFIFTSMDRWWRSSVYCGMAWERGVGVEETSLFFACSASAMMPPLEFDQLIFRVPRLRCNSICHLEHSLCRGAHGTQTPLCPSHCRCGRNKHYNNTSRWQMR